MFLSIFLASCRPDNLAGFLNNLAQTANDPSSFEVLVKIDDDNSTLEPILKDYQNKVPFSLKYIIAPKLDGYYSLQHGYNQLLTIANPDTYFCWLLTDEIRFESKGWDSILQPYIGYFPDNVFRLKVSENNLRNYYDFYDCLPLPDNYAVTTRKWLELTGGWGDFWGPDSWHQCIDYFLGLPKNGATDMPPVYRSLPLVGIKIGGQAAGQGIDDFEKVLHRELKIWSAFKKLGSHAGQENFYRLANRLKLHIYAKSQGVEHYILVEDTKAKTIALQAINVNKSLTFVAQVCYKLPRLRLQLFVAYRNKHIFTKPAIGYSRARRLRQGQLYPGQNQLRWVNAKAKKGAILVLNLLKRLGNIFKSKKSLVNNINYYYFDGSLLKSVQVNAK